MLIGQYVTVFGDVISHVNISGVKTEDGGEYECTAHNKAGSTSHAATLNVYGECYLLNQAEAKEVENISFFQDKVHPILFLKSTSSFEAPLLSEKGFIVSCEYVGMSVCTYSSCRH